MKQIALICSLALLAGCIDFDWPLGTIECSTDEECPGGLYCSLDAGVCQEEESTAHSCETASDCSEKECAVAACNSHVCEYTAAGELCGPGEICDESLDFTCKNAICVGASIDTPTMLIGSSVQPQYHSLKQHDNGYIMSWSDEGTMHWGLFDSGLSALDLYSHSQNADMLGTTMMPHSLGDGFSIAASGLVGGSYNVFVQFLEEDGAEFSGSPSFGYLSWEADPTPVPDWESVSHDAAMELSLGNAGQFAAVWRYGDGLTSGSPVVAEPWAIVFDIETRSWAGSNMKLADIDVQSVKVAAIGSGFMAAILSTDHKISVVLFDSNGPVGEPVLVQDGGAYLPIEIEWDGGQQVALAWRNDESEGAVMKFRTIGLDGSVTGDVISPVALGPTTSTSVEVFAATSEIDIQWLPASLVGGDGKWVIVWDGEPEVPGGDELKADIQLTVVDSASKEIPKPINISDAFGISNFPEMALREHRAGFDLALVWQDRRDDPLAVSNWTAKLYYSIIRCL